MTKRALLVGINNYRDPRAKLRGCLNDISRTRDMLTSFYGFKPIDIALLLDSDATRSNIQSGFESLIRYVLAGDHIVFWFSGHGTQKFDASEPDQMSECVVPWETTFDSLIPDKWFAQQLGRVTDRAAGSRITLVFDCCHSGSITRVLDLSMSEPDEICRNRWLPITLLEPTATMTEPELQERSRAWRGRGGRSIQMGPWDVLSACQDAQTAADTFLKGEFRGAFSFCLLNALQSDRRATFEKLERESRQLLRDVNPTHVQEPAFEISSLQATFLGG